jgi:valyl-tRNA synthetase
MPELAPAYDPAQVEDRLYRQWMERGDYRANPTSAKPAYSIVIPPPNVTGILTLGHVLNNTIQDILARRARLLGHEVLWLPGTDHAGIATQTVVERTLKKDGKIRHRDDLGREAFLQEIWKWKEKHGGIIIQQLKKLGASCDWSRERFTMDPAYSACVQQVFVDLFKKKLIYRGRRMVNWCPVSRTALSDEEVIMKEQKGLLYHFRVQVAGQKDRFLTIATTRPETIPGDTAIAVNPKDPRYAALIGQFAIRPLPPELPEAQRRIPIIGDEHVDLEFGTGVLKVTPAHDPADFLIGQRHKLSSVEVIDESGLMNAEAGSALAGLDRTKARTAAAEQLKELGLLEKEDPYVNQVGFSERADVPVEPRLSEQWFLRYPSTEKSRTIVSSGKLRFFPERWSKVYDHWMGNLQDWCISRQLWWGHRIPVWYRDQEARCQIQSPGDGWTQDPDVLDTWFSSWLWPFATMGWPEKTAELKKFYPTTDLVTGPDIIFFWVARMIMAGFEYQGDLPFRNVYFTGLIRDAKGRKLSKSLGNSPDPLDLISKYGADGLRFGLLRIAPQGADIRYDEKQMEEGRNFANKLWNACRFRQQQGPSNPEANPSKHPRTPFSDYLLARLDRLERELETLYQGYEFSQVAQALYAFVWDEFCARFIETAKADFMNADSPTRPGTLATADFVLSRVLRLLHPYMPFITEELWLTLGLGDKTIQYSVWPRVGEVTFNVNNAQAAESCYGTAEAGRRLRGEFGLSGSAKMKFLLKSSPSSRITDDDLRTLAKLLQVGSVEMTSTPPKAPMTLTPWGELYLPLAGLLDPAKETARLQKEIAATEMARAREAAKLADQKMTAKAPTEKQEEWRKLEKDAIERIARLHEQLKLFTT